MKSSPFRFDSLLFRVGRRVKKTPQLPVLRVTCWPRSPTTGQASVFPSLAANRCPRGPVPPGRDELAVSSAIKVLRSGPVEDWRRLAVHPPSPTGASHTRCKHRERGGLASGILLLRIHACGTKFQKTVLFKKKRDPRLAFVVANIILKSKRPPNLGWP